MVLTVKTEPTVISYKVMGEKIRRDILPKGKYSFIFPGIYGLIGNLGSGNHALSYVLTGNAKIDKCEFILDDKVLHLKDLREISCYIGHPHNDLFPLFNSHYSLKKTISNGLKQSHSSYKLNDIVQKFELSPERIDRPFKYLGNERWRASIAISYAFGRKIFCSNYFSRETWSSYYELAIKRWVKLIKEDGGIVLLPTNDESVISDLVDQVYYF